MSTIGVARPLAELLMPIRMSDKTKVLYVREHTDNTPYEPPLRKADVVVAAIAEGGSGAANQLEAATASLASGGLLIIAGHHLNTGGLGAALSRMGLKAQRSLTQVHQEGRSSLVIDDACLQTFAAASASAWLMSRAIGDASPSIDNSCRMLYAAGSFEDLRARLRDGSAWTTDRPAAESRWQQTRELLPADGGWALWPLASAPAGLMSGPLAATNVIARIPPGLNGENIIGHLLLTGPDTNEATANLRDWAASARAILQGGGSAPVPFDVQPSNFVVGEGGWQYVDNGLAVRFPYPEDVFLMRGLVWLWAHRLRPRVAYWTVRYPSARHLIGDLMRRVGSTVSDLTVDLWLQFECDLETRTSAQPRARAEILSELRALLESAPSDLPIQPRPPRRAAFAGESGAATSPPPRVTEANPLFDADWYLARYQDVRDQGIDAYEHFRGPGWREGRNPSAFFDTDWYLEQYPDVGSSGLNPLDHYLNVGGREGRNPGPAFDAQAYLSRYPDVRESGMNPLLHYKLHGSVEGRQVTHVDQPMSFRPASQTGTIESPVDELALLLQDEYGLSVASIAQVVRGSGSEGFRVRAVDNSQWFVKLSPKNGRCSEVTARGLALLASQKLSSRVTSGRIVAPRLRNEGLPTAPLGNDEVAVFPFVELQSISDVLSWSDEDLAEVSRFIGEMHLSSLSLTIPRFRNQWPRAYTKLARILSDLDRPPASSAPHLALVSDMIGPHREDLLALIEEYSALCSAFQAAARTSDVLCHTDLYPPNLGRDLSGRLVLIDNEDMSWAPPECDLFFLLDTRRLHITLEAYGSARGRYELQLDALQISYYADLLGFIYLTLCRLTAPGLSHDEFSGRLADLQRTILANSGGRFHDAVRSYMETIGLALGRSC